MIAAAFTGIHGNKIPTYDQCQLTLEGDCLCKEADGALVRTKVYQDIRDCDVLITSVKDYLILQCALNAIASGVCFWFVILLWKARYQNFYSGLRFFSYSAHLPPHP